MFVDEMCQYDSNVRQIESRGRDVEDRYHRLCGANTNAIQTDAKENNEPNGVDWSVSVCVDLTPESVQQSAVSTMPSLDKLLT